MKFFLYPFIALYALTGCNLVQEHITYLGPKQMSLLTTQPTGSMIVFDENGNRTSTTVSKKFIEIVSTENHKGSIFGGNIFYRKQTGSVSCDMENGQKKIEINVYSSDPYQSQSKPGQSIKVLNDMIYSSVYEIDFANKFPSVTINGVTYTDVVLGIDAYRNDTLYWKKDIGILGWKRADQSFTAYRVF